MKVFNTMGKGVVCVLSSVLIFSCVNHITEEDELVNDGNIQLKIAGNIHEVTNTRVIGNNFEEGDEIGLFALAGSTTMKEERYADNLHLVRSSGGDFIADESVYYPDDGVTLNLISYYPYQEKGIPMGESAMQVAVEADQTNAEKYSHSDFLVASRENVLASKEAVALTYNHRFFRMKIALTPGEGENIENMLAASPQLSVNGFYTKTIYDFQKDSYSGYSDESGIIPAGEWKIENGKLVGKELILIPQETTAGYQYITLQIGGKEYTSLLPSTLKLLSGKQRELVITFVTAEDILMSKVSGEIEDWEGTETDQTESEILHEYIDISKLTFDHSDVYKVLSAGKQVAEICKEYLVTPELSSQAIVAYPMKADHTVDLSKGLVVKLLGQDGKVHGGTVSWNLEDHTLAYTSGTLVARSRIYILADGHIALSISEGDHAMSVLALNDVVRDVRGGTIHNYPIVKIGTQYWMKSNLEASLYADGKEIPQLDKMSEGASGYLLSANKKNYFYSFDVVNSNNLFFEGWGLPDWTDWNLLKTYINSDASLLKAGTWKAAAKDEGAVAGPATNLTGFNALPVGMYSGIYQSDYEGKYVFYWTMPNADEEVKVLVLQGDSNEIKESKIASDRAFAIRCIRK